MISEEIGSKLKSKGIRPSFQRLKIYEYLLNNRTHPTVDTIYRALSNEIPSLSKTTVYNTLNLFLENSLVNIIVIEENETRYDAETKVHGHFKCSQCGEIEDLWFDENLLTNIQLENFKVNEAHIYFKGLCLECKN